MPLKARAPGSLMLLGEHAVLYGKPALVCAIDQFIDVTLIPNIYAGDGKIDIDAGHLGCLVTNLSSLKIEKPFEYVMTAIQQLQPKIKRGFQLIIRSEFSHQLGFGSSAAVTVATLAALYGWLNVRLSSLDLIRQARFVVKAVQGVGSGADIAASVLGGIVSYQPHPLAAEKFTHLYPLTVVYSGEKKKTTEVIQHVKEYFQPHPDLFKQLMNSIGSCAALGAAYIRGKSWDKLGNLFDVQQGLMEALNVSNAKLNALVQALRQESTILGAKISGSGLGDCVIGLGKQIDKVEAPSHIPVAMTLQGVHCEKI